MDRVNCAMCSHNWIPRVADPQKCPKCCSYSWKDGNGKIRFKKTKKGK